MLRNHADQNKIPIQDFQQAHCGSRHVVLVMTRPWEFEECRHGNNTFVPSFHSSCLAVGGRHKDGWLWGGYPGVTVRDEHTEVPSEEESASIEGKQHAELVVRHVG